MTVTYHDGPLPDRAREPRTSARRRCAQAAPGLWEQDAPPFCVLHDGHDDEHVAALVASTSPPSVAGYYQWP